MVLRISSKVFTLLKMDAARAVFVFTLILLSGHVVDAQTYSFAQNSATLLESSGSLTVQIDRTGSTAQPASVNIAAVGSGTVPASSNDFSVPTVATFDSQQSSTNLNITIINDENVEPDETFTLILSANDGGTITPISTMTVTIQNDDATSYTIGFASDSTFKILPDESVQTVTLTVNRSPATGTTSVGYAFSGAATYGMDYTSTSTMTGSLSFADGEATKTITITIVDDQLTEDIESIIVTLSSTGQNIIVQTSESKIYIPKNDETGLVSTSYNCFRNGQDCKNSATCVNGACDCGSLNPPYGGYDCTYKIADTSNGTCATSPPHDCGPNAQCYDTGTGANCFCYIGYIKDDKDQCTIPRYRVACTKEFMTMVATPAGTFDGEIFIKDHYSTSECKFVKSGNDFKMEALLNNGSNCGDAVIEDLGNGDYKVKRTFRIEYSKIMSTIHDETINVECNTRDTVQISTGFSPTNVNTSGLTQVDGNGKLDIVDLLMTNQNGDPVTPSMQFNVGDQITFKLSVSSASYAGIVLLWMAVDNNKESPNDISTALVTQRCVDPGTKLIVAPGPTHPNNNVHAVSVTFRVMVYKTSTEIRIRFKSQICLTSNADCAVQCSARRKRATGDQSQTNDMSVLLNVNNAFSSIPTKVEKTNEKVCVHSTPMVAIVASLSAVIFILLMICLALFVRSVTRKPSKNHH
ncbi:EGF-like domain-containing protein 2 [Gigantopelta aegis]|uniref:EGF-like domain-containing protein 2 n=1 Tax=Gigantopelta aegis TaxID=1735272 RepID=UPI001B88C5E6|nr:EGF-like domain-containing protein 2 [Gigantopelta aegis]